jgi:endonuclease/exonuclease/phosphatase (EEP) superfamily protein YafD
MNDEPRSRPGKRLFRASFTLTIATYVGLLAAYFVLHMLGSEGLWFIEALGYVVPWLFAPLLVLLPLTLLRRRRALLALIAAPVILFLLLYGGLYLSQPQAATAGQPFTMLTYNINGLNRDVEAIATAIEAHAPDVVALHEVNTSMGKALEAQLLDRYPYRQRERGIGLYSRFPIKDYHAFQLGNSQGLWAQQCALLMDGRELTLLNVHPRSPAGQPRDIAAAAHAADVRDLLARVDEIDGPLLVVGDLNLSDQHAAYAKLTRHLGDSHREAGWGMGFTFRPFAVGPALWRIDYVLHSPDLVALDAELSEFGGSDHRPLIVTLAWGR